jgi:hypothetical protein
MNQITLQPVNDERHKGVLARTESASDGSIDSSTSRLAILQFLVFDVRTT